MFFEDIENKNKELIEVAKKYMSSIEDNEHGIGHMYDVVNYTKKILTNMTNKGIDAEVCIISAYWHDVGRVKINEGHEKLSADMLKEEMQKRGYKADKIQKCYSAIEFHKWNMSPKTIEGLILKDADKLGFLGENRWNKCLMQGQKLNSIISLLSKLREEILYFDESRKIYDEEMVKLVKRLYDKIYK